MRITVTRHVQAPIDKTYEYFIDIEKIADRIKGIETIEILEHGGEDNVGLRWRETRTMFGREATEEMWISAAEKDLFYEVQAKSNGMKYLTRYEFTSNSDGTGVSLSFSGRPVSLMAKIMAPMMSFMAGSMRKALEADMDDLARLLENN